MEAPPNVKSVISCAGVRIPCLRSHNSFDQIPLHPPEWLIHFCYDLLQSVGLGTIRLCTGLSLRPIPRIKVPLRFRLRVQAELDRSR